jgi:hypothetical protein
MHITLRNQHQLCVIVDVVEFYNLTHRDMLEDTTKNLTTTDESNFDICLQEVNRLRKYVVTSKNLLARLKTASVDQVIEGLSPADINVMITGLDILQDKFHDDVTEPLRAYGATSSYGPASMAMADLRDAVEHNLQRLEACLDMLAEFQALLKA